jgi:hypothetical protein
LRLKHWQSAPAIAPACSWLDTSAPGQYDKRAQGGRFHDLQVEVGDNWSGSDIC